MKEKNDIISDIESENAAETAPEASTETISETTDSDEVKTTQIDSSDTQEENTDEGYVPQFADVITDTALESAPVKTKKRTMLMPSIIISVCILLVAIVAGVAFLLFFNTSVAGTYVIDTGDTEDAIQTYFILGEDGSLTQKAGSIEMTGSYEVTTEDNVSKITFKIPANYVDVTYNYKIEGNKLTGMKINMSDDNGNTMTFLPTTYEETVVEPIKDAKVDSKLVGTWEDKTGYGLKYSFKDDNTLVMSGEGMNIYCYYSAKDNIIDVKYQAAEVIENSTKYSFDGDTLILNSDTDYPMEFSKVEE